MVDRDIPARNSLHLFGGLIMDLEIKNSPEDMLLVVY